MKLKDFAPHYMRLTKLKPAYRITKQGIIDREILPTFGDMHLTDISLLDIDVWLAALRERGLAAKTINNHSTVLRNIFRKAIRYGYVTSIPLIEPEKVDEKMEPFLTEEQSALLLSKLTAAFPEWVPFFDLALNTGLRVGEMRALRWQDVALGKNPQLTIRHTFSGRYNFLDVTKGAKDRVVPLNKRAVNIIENLDRGAKSRLPGSGYVFGQPGPVSYKAVQCRFRWMRVVMRLDWISSHTFRHSFASQLAMSGKVSILEIKDLLGHVDISTTMRYAKLMPGALQRAVSALDKP